MKKIILSTLVIALAIINVKAQNGAVIEYSISSNKSITGTTKLYYSDKGTRMEIKVAAKEMPGGGFNHTSIINNGNSGSVLNLDDKNKTYSISEIKPTKPEDDGKCDNCVVNVIGNETIGKYVCTKATITKGNEVNTYWVTNRITDFEKYARTKLGGKYMISSKEYSILRNNRLLGFIVKSTTKDEHGNYTTIELINYEKKNLDPLLFEVPKDYKQNISSAQQGSVQTVDPNKLQSMSPEERKKYIEEMKKQAATQTPSTGK